MDYKINDTVLYGADGVCRIAEISELPIGKEKIKYYILRPVYAENSKIMVPVANEKLVARMKPVLTREEISVVLENATDLSISWTEDDAERREKFKEILEYGKTAERLQVLKLLYIKRSEREKNGKKLRVTDERILKEIEKALFDELALALDVKRDGVRDYLIDKLGL